MHLNRSKKYILISLAVAVILVALSPLFLSIPKAISSDPSTLSRLNIERITVALLQYSKDYGKNIQFPPNLQTLYDKKYLKDPRTILCVTCGEPYVYISGLTTKAPHDLPIIMEKNPHYFFKQDKNYYGWIAYLDFSIYGYRKQKLKMWKKRFSKISKVVKRSDGSGLLSMLRHNQDPLIRTALIWRLGKIKYTPSYPLMKKYIKMQLSFLDIASAYALKQKDPKSLKIIARFLVHRNYLRRKRAWQTLIQYHSVKTELANLIPISLLRCKYYYQKWYGK